MKFFRRKVKRGTQLGRKLGFPTINLNIGEFRDYFRQGVYGCQVCIGNRSYSGLLYYGPRLIKRGRILEIYIHHFSRALYDQWVRFKVGRFIRGPQKFISPAALQSQMQKDLKHLA